MLHDRDRIFTNLYGEQPPGPRGARAARRLGRHQGPRSSRAATGWSSRSRTAACAGAAGPASRTGLKWSFMPKQPTGPAYLVVNADESEPGTCKDREIMRHDPHKLVEGCLIAGAAMGCTAGYIYIRGEFIREGEALEAAIQEAYDAGLLGKNACGSGYDFDALPAPRCRRLHLRRGDGADREPGGQEGPAAAEAAVPGHGRPLRPADHGQQCRDDRRGADDPAPRRRPGSRASAGRTTPAPRSTASPAT